MPSSVHRVYVARQMETTDPGDAPPDGRSQSSDSTYTQGTCSPHVENKSPQHMDSEMMTTTAEYGSQTPHYDNDTFCASDALTESKVVLTTNSEFDEDDLTDVIAESLIILASDIRECKLPYCIDDSSECSIEEDRGVLCETLDGDLNALLADHSMHSGGVIKDDYWWEHSINPIEHTTASTASLQSHISLSTDVGTELTQDQSTSDDVQDMLSDAAYLTPVLSFHCDVHLPSSSASQDATSVSPQYVARPHSTSGVKNCWQKSEQRVLSRKDSEPVEELKEFLRLRKTQLDYLKPSEIRCKLKKISRHRETLHEQHTAIVKEDITIQQPASVSSLVQKFEGVMEKHASRSHTKLPRQFLQNKACNTIIHFPQLHTSETVETISGDCCADMPKPNCSKIQVISVKSSDKCAGDMPANHIMSEKNIADDLDCGIGLHGTVVNKTHSGDQIISEKMAADTGHTGCEETHVSILQVSLPSMCDNAADTDKTSFNKMAPVTAIERTDFRNATRRNNAPERFSSFLPFIPAVSSEKNSCSDNFNPGTNETKTKCRGEHARRIDLETRVDHSQSMAKLIEHMDIDVAKKESACSLLDNLGLLENRADELVLKLAVNRINCKTDENRRNRNSFSQRRRNNDYCSCTLNDILSDCRDIKQILREENDIQSSDTDETGDESFVDCDPKSLQSVNQFTTVDSSSPFGSMGKRYHVPTYQQGYDKESNTNGVRSSSEMSSQCHMLGHATCVDDSVKKGTKYRHGCGVNNRGDMFLTTCQRIKNSNRFLRENNRHMLKRDVVRHSSDQSCSVASSNSNGCHGIISERCQTSYNANTGENNVNRNNRDDCDMVCSAKIRARCQRILDRIKRHSRSENACYPKKKVLLVSYRQSATADDFNAAIAIENDVGSHKNMIPHCRKANRNGNQIPNNNSNSNNNNNNNNNNTNDNENASPSKNPAKTKDGKLGKSGLVAKASKLFKLSHKRYAKTMKKTRQYLRNRSKREKENKLDEPDKDHNVAVTMGLIQENMNSATDRLRNIHAMLGVEKSNETQTTNDGSTPRYDAASEVDDMSVTDMGSSRTTLVEQVLRYSDVNALPSGNIRSAKSLLDVPWTGVCASTQTSESLGTIAKSSVRGMMSNRRSVSFAGAVKIPVSPTHGTFVITAYNRSDAVNVSYVDRSSARYFPPIFSHLSYVIVTLASIACAVGCLWAANGLNERFGYRWMAIVLLSFFQDVMLLEPLKVIAVASYLTFCRERLL